MELFTITDVARLSGLSEHTLRMWERRYGVPKPLRTPSGRRMYPWEEVDRLKLLKKLTEQGTAIGRLAPLTLEDLRRQFLSPSELNPGPEIAATVGTPHVLEDPQAQKLKQQLVKALDIFDTKQIFELINSARVTLGARNFVFQFGIPLLQDIGNRTAAGTLSIAQEHIVSALLRDQIGFIQHSLIGTAERTPVSLATPEGNLHEFGILFTNILFLSQGLRPLYLGPNLPASAMAPTCEALGLKVLVLGCAGDNSAGFKTSKGFLVELAKLIQQPMEIWVGGLGQIKTPPAAQKPNLRWTFFSDLHELDGLIRR